MALRRKSTVVRINDDNTLTVTPEKCYGKPGRHIVFVVENHSDTTVKVRIPPNTFKPDPPPGKKKSKKNPDKPMKPLQGHKTTVAANEATVIRLKIRGEDDFPESGNWTYKYSVFWKAEGVAEEELDPQIEINN
jgi:hypothetical protein